MPRKEKEKSIKMPKGYARPATSCDDELYTAADKSPVIVIDIKDGKVALSGQNQSRGEASPGKTPYYYDVQQDAPVELAEPPVLYQSKMAMVEIAQKGVRANTLKGLTELLDISLTDMAGLFHFSERTLRDYVRKNKLLDPDSSEKIVKIFSLYLYGCDVLEGAENFIRWLYTPSFGLQDKIPARLLYSSDGIDLVYEELSRIEHGDLS